jgi:CBS domain-containing protein
MAHGHLAAAAYTMNHANQSALVVVDQADRPVAIITEGDLMRAVAQGAETGRGPYRPLDESQPGDRRPGHLGD